MAEKKKGFWSWLGFGKKEEAKPQEEITPETAEQPAEVEESLKEKIEAVSDKIEDKLEQIEETVEEHSDKIEDFVEEKVEKLKDFVEDAKEQVEQFVENKLEEVKNFFHEESDKIEQAFEQEKGESISIVDVTAPAEQPLTENTATEAQESVEAEPTVTEAQTETVAETEQSPVEQAVETAQEFANVEPEADLVAPEVGAEETTEEAEVRADVQEELLEEATAESTDEQEILAELVAEDTEAAIREEALEAEQAQKDEYQEKPSEGGFFSRLLKGLVKTKQSIGSGFRNFFRGKHIDDELFEELEEQLLVADLGMPTTTKIINNLTQHATKQQLKDADLLYQQLKVELADVLKPVSQPLEIDTNKKPYVILMVGVNGVGKTTTIGKLARKFQDEGKSVMLAAGDTFRAAAVEQLQVWGERNNIPVVAQATGSDSASVIFDAMQSAASKGIDILIADTAGRLQNKNNLMDELKKIVRVMKKYDESAPHEIMLTLDAGTGQNAISQAKLFNESVGLTGISLTKLDGTAKGGVIFAIADQFKLPIRFIGVGEKIEDLRPFNADEFIEALFEHE